MLEELALSGLASWPPELVDPARSLLVEYHDVLSLELGCTHSTKNVIKIMDNYPFQGAILMDFPAFGGRSP